jgi:hypothetical protein
MFGDECGPDPRAKTEEQHPPTVVTAERLQDRVVRDAQGFAERTAVIEINPTTAEISRFRRRAMGADRARISDRDGVEFPIARQFPDPRNGAFGCQVRS